MAASAGRRRRGAGARRRDGVVHQDRDEYSSPHLLEFRLRWRETGGFHGRGRPCSRAGPPLTPSTERWPVCCCICSTQSIAPEAQRGERIVCASARRQSNCRQNAESVPAWRCGVHVPRPASASSASCSSAKTRHRRSTSATRFAGTESGLKVDLQRLPATATLDELLQLVKRLNASDEHDGILVQAPLPSAMGRSASRKAS